MTKKTRIILICVLVSLFFLITPIAILYSQGYRFDFNPSDNGKRITQTGGLFLKISPRSADIYLDEILADKTDFLFGSVLIENLVPKKYKIRVEKENYQPWKKTLEIKEKQVANSKNITLVPKNPEFINLTENVKNFWSFPNQKNLIIQEQGNNGWALKIFDLEKIIKSHLAAESKNAAELLDITFSLDSKMALLKTKVKTEIEMEKEEVKYFIMDLTKSPSKIISLDFFTQEADKISFHPKNSEKIFFLKNNRLFEENVSNLYKLPGDSPLAILENILDYQTTRDNIYYLDKDGWIFRINFLFNSREKLINQPFVLNLEKNYRLKVKQDYVFLFEDRTLYFLNPKTKSLEKLSESVNSIKISPDKRKALYCNDYEIWILFLEKQEEQPKRDMGDKVFLTRFSKKISDILWWTSHYLIFEIENQVKIIEIDNRDKINIYDLPPTTFVYKSGEGQKFSGTKIIKSSISWITTNYFNQKN